MKRQHTSPHKAPTQVGASFFYGGSITQALVISALLLAVVAPFSVAAAMLLLPVTVLAWRRLAFPREWLGWLMLGWLAWLPLSLTWSMSPGLSLPQMAPLLCLPLGWFAGRLMRERGQLDGFLKIVLPGTLIVLLVWGWVSGPDESFNAKMRGPFNDPNTYAAILNLLALPILSRYLAADLVRTAVWWRTGHLALMACWLLALFLVASRGAFLVLLVVSPFVMWSVRHRPGFARKVLLLAVVMGVAYGMADLAREGMSSVVLRLTDTLQQGDPARLMLLTSTWYMVQEHPWLGTGLGTFRLLYPRYRDPSEIGTGGGWVHNDYMQIWAEAGLPMLLLLLGMVAWVIWSMYRHLRKDDADSSPIVGYLAGIVTVLLHAHVNFLLFFSIVTILAGLYLACAGTNSDANTAAPRGETTAIAAIGYAMIVGILFAGQLAVELFLGQAVHIKKILSIYKIAYSRYEAAYWTSILAPFSPIPSQTMGLELAEGYLMTGGGFPMMREEALDRMETAMSRARCYLPYSSDALNWIQMEAVNDSMFERARSILNHNFSCNARHGLSYYYAGKLSLRHSESEARVWWCAGLAASPILLDKLLLTSVILAHTYPEHEKELMRLSVNMADTIRALEANPNLRADAIYWNDALAKIWRVTGPSSFTAMTAKACHEDMLPASE